jgi:hypothetical protein
MRLVARIAAAATTTTVASAATTTVDDVDVFAGTAVKSAAIAIVWADGWVV